LKPPSSLLEMLGGLAGLLLMLLWGPVPASVAISPAYLPLAVGNRWELRSRAHSTPVVFEVTSRSADSFLVRWDNPWVKSVVYGFRPSGHQVLLQSLDLGNGAAQLPEETVYFDLSGTGPKSWNNMLGEFFAFGSPVRVDTPSGGYENCIHIRYRSKEKADAEYFLAPGIGFVQLGTGPAAYKLVSFRKK
jgi:hypothetical protein